MMRVNFEGKSYNFPDDATDQEIASFFGGQAQAGQASPSPTTSGFVGGDVPLMEHTPEESAQNLHTVLRQGPVAAAGIAGGMIPGAGVIAGPLAAGATDLVMAKAFGEGDDSKARETNFLFDLGFGLVPPTIKTGAKAVEKLIPAPVEARIASVIRWGFNKGIRPTVVGKSNFAQTEKYFQKAQNAVETIIENKPALRFADEAGNVVAGRLPKNLNEFSQSIDQTKRNIFQQYDSMLKHTELTGRTVDVADTVGELMAFANDPVHRVAGGGGVSRANELISQLQNSNLTLSQTQDLVAVLNARRRAFLANPTPDLVSTAAVDSLVATRLRMGLDRAVENLGYQPLRNSYGSLRSIEKEVAQRATVDARKNIKGLIDFADIASAAEAARAIATFSTAPAAAAGAIKAMKEIYKHLNNPNRVIKKMFSEAEELILKQRAGAVPLRVLPPGPRTMGGKMPDSYARGVQGEVQPTIPRERGYALKGGPNLLGLPPKGGTSRDVPALDWFTKLRETEYGYAGKDKYDINFKWLENELRKRGY